MRCELRSRAAGVKSRQSGAIEVIIKKLYMALQYESPGRDRFGGECFSPRISVRVCGEVDLATDGSAEVSACGGLLGRDWSGNRQRRAQAPGGIHGLVDPVRRTTKAFERGLEGLAMVAPRAGLEPATSRLTAGCSTN